MISIAARCKNIVDKNIYFDMIIYIVQSKNGIYTTWQWDFLRYFTYFGDLSTASDDIPRWIWLDSFGGYKW